MSLESEIIQLKANPLFAQFDDEALRLLAFSSDTRNLRPDEILFREDEVSDGGYFILSGAIVLSSGETEEICGPGALVGETALFTETRRPATAITREQTSMRRIPRHLMRRVLTAYPASATRVHAYLREKILSIGDSLARAEALLMADDGVD